MLQFRSHILFLGALLLFSSSLLGQGWEQTYGGSAYDVANDILPAANGGFYLLGSTSSTSNGDSDILLTKTGPDGELEWSKNIGDSTWFEYGQSFKYTSDGGLIIAGTAIQPGENNRIHIIKTDLQGNIAWQNKSTQDSVSSRSVIELANGHFLVSGNRFLKRTDNNNTVYTDTDVFLYKVDASGSELSQTSHGGELPEDGFAVHQNAPGKALVVGYTRSFGNGGYDIYLLEIDTQTDSIIQSKTYGTPFEELGYAFSPTNDGGYVITGQQDVNDASSENFFLLKIGADLEELWRKSYDLPGLETGRTVTQSPAGAFLIAGEVRNSTSSNRDPFMIKTDSNGNLIWTKRYGGLLGDGTLAITNCPDEGFALAGYTFSFGAGGADAYLIRSDSSGTSYAAVVYGNVYEDLNLDCAPAAGEAGIAEWILSASGNITRHAMTDSTGNYLFYLDTGAYEIEVFPPNSYWEPCDNQVSIELFWSMDTVEVNFPIQPEIICPLLSVNISTPFIRTCFPNNYTLQYCNNGTDVAEDAYVEVDFAPDFVIDTASVPFTRNGNLITFQLGDVDLFDCGMITIYTELDPNCTDTYLGQTHCVEAHIYPDSLCQPIDPDWDGSSIEIDASCNGDSVQFTITNVGQGDMVNTQRFIIIEDHIVSINGDFDLDSFQDTIIMVPATGGSWRFEAEQSLGHPGDNEPSISVEGCGGAPFSVGHLIQLPQNDGNPFIDIDCQESVGSYDPNDKQGFPKGYGDEHFILANTDLEYLIRFQNTGTDTAFRVIIRDTLSFDLDITSIQTGVGSHPYTFDIYDERVLKFTFDNILLPDSAANEIESHGFIKFKVSQTPDNPIGTLIKNNAGIYFDFNLPIVTNETFHLVGKNFVDSLVGTNELGEEIFIKYYPNPFTDQVTFELSDPDISSAQLLSFSLYDLHGRLLRKESFQGNSFTFYSKNLANGFYPFRIETKDGLVYRGKLIMGR